MTIYLFDSIFHFKNASLVEWFTWGCLTLTLIVLCFYTFYTKKLQETAKEQTDELIKQRRLSIMPSLSLDADLSELQMNLTQSREEIGGDIIRASRFTLTLFNVGNGIALNISIQFLSPILKENKFEFDKVYSLSPKDSVKVPAKLIYSKELKTDEKIQIFLKIFFQADAVFETIFTFQDIEGNKYRQVNTVSSIEAHHGIVEIVK